MTTKKCSAPHAIAVAFALTATLASAETVYRCGDTYTHVACANAKAVDLGEPATAAARHQARLVAERERQLALDMVRDRHERERETRPALAASLGPIQAVAATTPPTKKRAKPRHRARPIESDDFIAAVPKTKR